MTMPSLSLSKLPPNNGNGSCYPHARSGELLKALGVGLSHTAETLSALQPYDFACFGIAQLVDDGVRVHDVQLVQGQLLEQEAQLRQRLTSLVAAWTTMESAIVLDLGQCACIGSRLLGGKQVQRLLAIDAQALVDGYIVFVAVSSALWKMDGVCKDTLRQALRVVMDSVDGQRVPEVLRAARFTLQGSSLCPSLSPRQTDIVRLIAAGYTNKEIAQQLGLSPFTVRNQISLMSDKTGHRRRSQLTSLLYRVHEAVVGVPA